MEDNIIIDVKNLSYKYRLNKRINDKIESTKIYKNALADVSFTVAKGEKISIIGPNGAGKSTLLLNLAGLAEQNNKSGEIYISGKILNDKNIYDLRENIGFVFQDPNDQLFSTTVFDDVAFGLINFLNKKKILMQDSKSYIMTPKETARYLRKSVSWIYKNWRLLGGKKLGGSLFFPGKEELYERIFHNREEGKRVEVRLLPRQEKIYEHPLQDKTGGKRSRSKKKGGDKEPETRDTSPNRHGILGFGES